MLSAGFGRLNDRGVPGNAIMLIAGVFLIVPFVGRTAIGWVVDVTTIGATLIYGFVSAAAMAVARIREDRTETVTGSLGLILMVCIGLSYMSRHSKENERRANIDPLTGVRSKNAYLFKEKQINASISTGEAGDFAVAVCDVNGLKKINDTLGHKAGEDYICKACRMVCEIFQHSPVFRVGGDEFVAILTGRDYESRKELMRILLLNV